MDVILLQDVERLGQAGAVVRVKPGFARNYLVPRKLAALATPAQLQRLDDQRRQADRKRTRLREQAETVKRQLEGRSLTMKLTLGEGDKPFGSVTAHDIAEALAQDGLAVEKHAVELDAPIKALGIYEVSIRLHPEVRAMLKVWVVKA